jgi:hypothetical protein
MAWPPFEQGGLEQANPYISVPERDFGRQCMALPVPAGGDGGDFRLVDRRGARYSREQGNHCRSRSVILAGRVQP